MTSMTSDEAKRYVKNNLVQYIRRFHPGVLKGDGHAAFKCLNPAHHDRRPSMSINYKAQGCPRCHCFSCGANYDTFDLIRNDFRIFDDAELFKKGYELFGIDVEGGRAPEGAETSEFQDLDKEPGEETTDFTDALKAAHLQLMCTPAAVEHFTRRGITQELLDRYQIGYLPSGMNSILDAGHKVGLRKADAFKYVFPVEDGQGRLTYFLAEIDNRALLDDGTPKYAKPKGYRAHDFNERYLSIKDPKELLFITEGIYDALSVEAAGYKAVALTGVGGSRLIRLYKEQDCKAHLVIALDNDDAGRINAAKLKQACDEAGIPASLLYDEAGDFEPTAGLKDLNDELVKGGLDFLKERLDRYCGALTFDLEAKELAEKEALYQHCAACDVENLEAHFKDLGKPLPTGISGLDRILDGGFYPGLYVIGAISSLGKTTLCMQIADHVAATGADVLIFSLEMSRYELEAKSLSRLTLEKALQLTGYRENAKSYRQLTAHFTDIQNDQGDWSIYQAAKQAYKELGRHIFITEGIGSISVRDIRSAVEKHIRLTSCKPLVFVDYCQILASPALPDERLTDKQAIDRSVVELKRISRDFDIPVLTVSSFNRDNYLEPVNFAAFKESGAIEYSSDVLLAMQLAGMDYREGEAEQARKKRIRSLQDAAIQAAKDNSGEAIELKVLKNRAGVKDSVALRFFPRHNAFYEAGLMPDVLAKACNEAQTYGFNSTIQND